MHIIFFCQLNPWIEWRLQEPHHVWSYLYVEDAAAPTFYIILPKSADFPFYVRSILIDPKHLAIFFFVDLHRFFDLPFFPLLCHTELSRTPQEGLVLRGPEMPQGAWPGGAGTASRAGVGPGEEEGPRWRGRSSRTQRLDKSSAKSDFFVVTS